MNTTTTRPTIPDSRAMPTETPEGRVRLYETGGGALYWVGYGVAVAMPPAGDFMSDCRLYRDAWDETDVRPDDVRPAGEVEHGEGYELVAEYDGAIDDVRVLLRTDGHPVAGPAAREYLGIDLDR